ncbi:MAG: hypothetical protein SFZ23_15040 [Planctomycetota bacterium]|nr:hypothetical protein [Planctomycetota bacterium]
MNEHDFQQRLSELMSQIDELPEAERGQLARLAAEAKNRHAQMKKTITDLTESIDYLRLSIKYLVFDLEATRRENDSLRKVLDQRNQQQDQGESEDKE